MKQNYSLPSFKINQMKKNLLMTGFLLMSSILSFSQKTGIAYPVPEYNDEIYLVTMDSAITLMRLEKGSSKQEMKVKMMGMGGMDQGYTLEEEHSPVRLSGGSGLIFLFYNGGSAISTTPEADSMMRANGMDPAMMSNPMSAMMDPTQSLSLYNMRPEKGKRKALLHSMGIMGKSKKTAMKYTLSVKKIKEGYYEMVVDKTLPRGEYTFVMMDMRSMDQSFSLFAFGVD
jgi:hypothetical protein